MFAKAILHTEETQSAQRKPDDLKQSSGPAFPAMTMSVEGMMNELHISRKTAYDLVKQKGFPSFRVGSRILVNREGLQRWIDRQCLDDVA